MSISYDSFLNCGNEFKLGHLTTESFHEKTRQLSRDCKENVSQAIESLLSVDKDMVNKLKDKSDLCYDLSQRLHHVISDGGRVFLVGCGATGRLSLSLEFLYRQQYISDHVVSLMAGGDYALIKSVESFEDSEQYSIRMLEDEKFCSKDILIAITEGGETTFVLSAAEYAAKVSDHSPYVLYCNPDSELVEIERCRRVIENKNINKICLNVGAMGLSGSTRMQASTAQMFFVGCALLKMNCSKNDFLSYYSHVLGELLELNTKALIELIEAESSLYLANRRVLYESSSDLAICVLTDTTERSPTFMLDSFERSHEGAKSKVYLSLFNETNSKKAWESLLGREPRGLDWSDLKLSLTSDDIYKFDISSKAKSRREHTEDEVFSFERKKETTYLHFNQASQELFSGDLFSSHLRLKVFLNIASTVIMGRIGRFESNVMTYVKPSNLKLIDRAVRYAQLLLSNDGYDYRYEEVVKRMYNCIEKNDNDPSIVLAVINSFK